jgi:hypothetical protein
MDKKINELTTSTTTLVTTKTTIDQKINSIKTAMAVLNRIGNVLKNPALKNGKIN